MACWQSAVGRLVKEEDGQSVFEYALIFSIVALGLLVAVYGLKNQVIHAFF